MKQLSFFKNLAILIMGCLCFFFLVCESDNAAWFWASKAIGVLLYFVTGAVAKCRKLA